MVSILDWFQHEQIDFMQLDLADLSYNSYLHPPWSAQPPNPSHYSGSRNEVKDDQREDLLMFQRPDHPRSVPSEARPPSWQECSREDQNNPCWLYEVNFKISSNLAVLWHGLIPNDFSTLGENYGLWINSKESSKMVPGSAGCYRKIKGGICLKMSCGWIITEVVG